MKLFEIKSEDPLTKPRQIRILTLFAIHPSDGGEGIELDKNTYGSVQEYLQTDKTELYCLFGDDYQGVGFASRSGKSEDLDDAIKVIIDYSQSEDLNDDFDDSESGGLSEKEQQNIGVFRKYASTNSLDVFSWSIEYDSNVSTIEGIDPIEMNELVKKFNINQ